MLKSYMDLIVSNIVQSMIMGAELGISMVVIGVALYLYDGTLPRRIFNEYIIPGVTIAFPGLMLMTAPVLMLIMITTLQLLKRWYGRDEVKTFTKQVFKVSLKTISEIEMKSGHGWDEIAQISTPETAEAMSSSMITVAKLTMKFIVYYRMRYLKPIHVN